jgi:hypothetical protein
MPKLDNLPQCLRPYAFHGVEFHWKPKDKWTSGDCPFCGHTEKFGIHARSGVHRCFKGGCKGNITKFLQWLWEESYQRTSEYQLLADDRRLIFAKTLERWHWAKSILTGDWILAGYTLNTKLVQLYRYIRFSKRFTLVPTPTISHKLFGIHLYDPNQQEVYLCEGPADAMVLWELLRHRGNMANVLAVPGCQVFFPEWSTLFARKSVVLLFDSDHPRTNGQVGKSLKPAGFSGMRRVASLLAASSPRPADISFLSWGPEGYDPKKPSGYDIRDYLTEII